MCEGIPLEAVGALVKVTGRQRGKMLVGPADESKHARDEVAVKSGHPRREVVRQQQRCDEDDGDQGGRKALDAASVEGGEEGGRRGLLLAKERAGDDKARDDKEDIDAHEASGQPRGVHVEEDDRDHRDCTQAIHVGPILSVRRSACGREAAAGRVAQLCSGAILGDHLQCASNTRRCLEGYWCNLSWRPIRRRVPCSRRMISANWAALLDVVLVVCADQLPTIVAWPTR